MRNSVRDILREVKKRVSRILLPPVEPQQSVPYPRNIALLAWERWGDSILLTSLLRGLQKGYPHATIHIFCFSNPSAVFFQHYSRVERTVVVKRVRFLPEILYRSRAMLYDWVVNPKDHFSFTFLMATHYLRSKYRIGLSHPSYTGYYHLLVNVPYESSMVEKYHTLLKHIGIDCSPEEIRPMIPLSSVRPEVREHSRSLQKLQPIGINMSASDPRRCLSEAQVQKLLDRFHAEPVLLFAYGKQRALLPHIARSHPNVLLPIDKCTLFETAAYVQSLRLLITPDTAFVHMASAMKTPVVVLYLNEHSFATRFSPYRIPYRSVLASTATIGNLPTSIIINAVEELLCQHAS